MFIVFNFWFIRKIYKSVKLFNNMESIQKLKEENFELKRALMLLMSKALIKKLSEALERINKGEYISEEDFFS